EDIPYTLTFTNTGDTPITNPVITDHIPSDADGPLLVKDPDLAEGDSGYTYALAGDAPDPPNGTAMPTDDAGTADDVTVQEDPTLLTFTFPEGTVLEVGQTYTITTALQFRTGLSGNTNVTNTTGITGDRAWDQCDQTLADNGECQASTTVYPTRAGALRGVKMVKADDDELGVNNTRDNPNGCQTNSQGFYVGGCVPVTKPGATDTWRMQFTNTGNLPQDKVYAVDRLPTPGDTGAITSLERGSQWTPTPVSISFVGANLGTVSAIRVYYDTDQDLCTEDLDNLQGCPDGEWTQLSTVDNPADGATVDLPANATALKVEADFAEDMLQPTGTLSYDLVTRAPAQSETAGEDTIAWNTVAAAAETDDGGTKALAPKSEGNKVGVALATGPLQIEKVVTGPAAEYAPAEFHLNLQCTSAGEDVDLGDKADVTVTPNEPVQVDDLPWGADCTVTEDPDSGTSGFEATTVTVQRADQTVPVIIATNTYNDASLSLTKSIGDHAVDQDGNPIAYGPFSFDVDCSFLGDPVYADGYSEDNPMTATINAGETATFTQLPAGSECTATETDNGGASSSEWSLNGGDYTDGDTATLALDEDGDNGAVTNEVDFRNDFPLTQLVIEKDVTGAGAEAYGAGPFTVHLHCINPNDDAVVYDDDIVLGGDQPLTTTVDELYDGASCEVTETANGGANSTTIDPQGPFTVSGDDPDNPVTVNVENNFQVAPVRVHKDLSGFGSIRVPDGTEYTVELACTREVNGETVPVDIPGGAERTLTTPDDLDATYSGLPVGATCTMTETDNGDATNSSIDPDGPFTIGSTDGVDVNVTNNYQAGAVRITKQITGGAADQVAAGTEFTVQLTCTQVIDGETVPVEFPRQNDGVATLTPDDPDTPRNEASALFIGIPLGAQCSVAETDTAGATTTTIDPAGTFTVTSNTDPVQVTATNDYPVAPVNVVKQITGDGASQVPDDTEFSVQLTCTTDFGGHQVPVDLPDAGVKTLTKATGLEGTWDDVPVGAECQAEELSTGSATTTTIDPEGPFTVTADSEQNPITVTATNDYPVGSVHLIKKVTGDAAGQVADGTEFTVQLQCTTRYGGDPVPVPLPDDGVKTLTTPDDLEADYPNIPLGAECSATETGTAGATSTTIDPSGTFTVDSTDQPVTLTATNEYDVAPVKIVKQITGDGADQVPDGTEFDVQLTCTTNYGGNEVPVELENDGVRTLTAPDDLEASYDSVPVGAQCRAAELTKGGATTTAIDPDGPFTVGPAGEDGTPAVTVTATNDYQVGAVQVIKKVTGGAADQVADGTDFKVQLTCTMAYGEGDPVPVTLPDDGVKTLTTPDDLQAEYTGIPAGAQCTVTETDTGGADASKITPDSVTVGTDDNQTASFEVVNTFDPQPTQPSESPTNAAPPAPSQPPSSGPSQGGLPNTGGPSLALAVLGALLLAAGVFFVAFSRRRNRG
ncbi:MAG TPA: DUF5979 domain-containing protein, partial [Microlunatus sp.]